VCVYIYVCAYMCACAYILYHISFITEHKEQRVPVAVNAGS
jgi:hypothetical protein